MDHEILPRSNDRSVVGQLLGWFHRRRVAATPADRTGDETQPRLTSTGRLKPHEDETSGEFADRVAAIKADVLRRALEALSSERFGAPEEPEEPEESHVDSEPSRTSRTLCDGELAEEDAAY